MIKGFEKTGHLSQLFSVEEMRLCGGKGDGMRILQMKNGKGLMATFVPDRCLDLYRLEYKGINLGFFSPSGYVAPAYYDKDEFLRSFTAGFFTTCGLDNAGAPGTDNGEQCVMHGRIGNVPCEQLAYNADYSGDHPVITASGKVSQGALFAEKMSLHREIKMENNTIYITDTVTNESGLTQPSMQLYHMNMGYPLLDEGVELLIPAKNTLPRDKRAEEGIDEWDYFPAPTPGFDEQCYYHRLGVKNGRTAVAIYNKELGVGVKISFNADTLNHFTQWKMPGTRDYVLGLEPANCRVEGRENMRKIGRLKELAPFESVTFRLAVEIIDGDLQAKAVREEIYALKQGD